MTRAPTTISSSKAARLLATTSTIVTDRTHSKSISLRYLRGSYRLLHLLACGSSLNDIEPRPRMDKSALGKLSPELRNAIYGLVLKKEHPTCIFSFVHSGDTGDRPWKGRTAFMGTCKGIYGETKQMLYAINEFRAHLCHRDEVKLFIQKLDNTGIFKAGPVFFYDDHTLWHPHVRDLVEVDEEPHEETEGDMLMMHEVMQEQGHRAAAYSFQFETELSFGGLPFEISLDLLDLSASLNAAAQELEKLESQKVARFGEAEVKGGIAMLNSLAGSFE